MEVSEIGYGAWGIGGKQWLGGDDDTSLGALRRAIDSGVNFIDTALAYNEGHSETLIGKVIRETKSKVYVATKIPPKNRIWPAKPGVPVVDVFPYEYVIESTETSLKNLGVEQLDLQQLHVWNPIWFLQDEWRRAVEKLKSSGKIRAFGVSINDHQPESALDLVASKMVDTVQVIYNIFEQSPERWLFPACIEHGVGVLARVPLDEGALTGTLRTDTKFEAEDFRAWYFRDGRLDEVVPRVAELEAATQAMAGTLAQRALRFCLTHPAVSTVIPGMRKNSSVDLNCAVSDLGPLNPSELAVMRRHVWLKNYYA
ncbi:aldo/keto reductase [Bryobacter aggregatus]|uniref:aldo/keto reductase n=1 Tax=Bryobacter aggregatus TaxID=360054 RepID=UPI001EE199EB|nr:aldo/keto reductase [Bryobacter aggregatus]